MKSQVDVPAQVVKQGPARCLAAENMIGLDGSPWQRGNPLRRGRPHSQCSMLVIVDLEERVPRDHPLQRIKVVANAALARLSPQFDRMHAHVGRASVPPERLLRASLLIALYSVCSERSFCKELEYNLLYRWTLDMDLLERSFDATIFTKNRQRLMDHDVGWALFDELVWAPRIIGGASQVVPHSIID